MTTQCWRRTTVRCRMMMKVRFPASHSYSVILNFLTVSEDEPVRQSSMDDELDLANVLWKDEEELSQTDDADVNASVEDNPHTPRAIRSRSPGTPSADETEERRTRRRIVPTPPVNQQPTVEKRAERSRETRSRRRIHSSPPPMTPSSALPSSSGVPGNTDTLRLSATSSRLPTAPASVSPSSSSGPTSDPTLPAPATPPASRSLPPTTDTSLPRLPPTPVSNSRMQVRRHVQGMLTLVIQSYVY